MVRWLENGLDFHELKDEEGVEGKSVVLVSNASLKAALTSSLGMRVVSHARILGVDACGAGAARQRRTQYARLTKIRKRMPKVQFCKKYGAITSKIAKASLAPSGLHGVRCMGMPPTRAESFQDHGWKMLTRQTCGTFSHLAAGDARVRSGTHVQGRAKRSVGRGSVGRAAGRCRFAQCLETTATIGGLEAVVEQGQCPDRRHHVPEAAGMDSGRTHTTFFTARGHEVDSRQTCPMDVKAQARADRELAQRREWADNDERRELLPCPSAGAGDAGEQASPTSPTRGASDQGGSGRNTIQLVDAGNCAQGRNC